VYRCVIALLNSKEGIDLWIDEVVKFLTHNSFHSLTYMSKCEQNLEWLSICAGC
jgi:hypothetical protein